MNKIFSNIINSFKYEPENRYIFDLPPSDSPYENNQITAITMDEKNILVVFNSNKKEIEINILEGKWSLVVNEERAGIKELMEIKDSKLKVNEKSAYVLIAK